MGIIHLRLKNICLTAFILFFIYVAYRLMLYIPYEEISDVIFGEDPNGPCNKRIRWLKTQKKWLLIGLVGVPESGVVWCRYLTEQLTGLYTGSTSEDHGHLFKGEGKIKNAVLVMSYDIDALGPRVAAAIVVYRNMKDTIRSQYAKQYGPGAFLEAPLDAYYGKEWETFAWNEGSSWAQRYQFYLDAKVPLLIIRFEELADPDQIAQRLLYISHFLHVPISNIALECLIERANDYHDIKPRQLKHGFHPFELLSPQLQKHLAHLENITETRINKARDEYLPVVHV